MSSQQQLLSAIPPDSMRCQIRVKGHLDAQWTDWFAGLTISVEENGDTLLTGTVADQAALHGLLKKTRDLGLPLISVICLDTEQTDQSTVNQ